MSNQQDEVGKCVLCGREDVKGVNDEVLVASGPEPMFFCYFY
jgi:hypothetical protein